MMQTAAENWVRGYRQNWPSATDDPSKGTWRQPRAKALLRRYIQANPSAMLTALVIDVDHEDALMRAFSRDSGVPPPSYVAQSPSGRAHVAYVLETPVCRTDNARMKPMHFAARVEAGLVRALDGDRGYAGFLTKNPIHDHWDTFWGAEHPYSLSTLAGSIPDLLPKSLPRKAADNSGLGRNVALFNRVRVWSYSAVRRYWEDGPRDWEEVTLAYSLAVNQEFASPLEDKEVLYLARSVSRWTWRNFTREGFSKVQAERGRARAAATNKLQVDRKIATSDLIRSLTL